MSNFTMTQAELEALMPKFWVYVLQGSALSIANLLILMAILRFKMLREKKEYIVVAALAFTDATNGLACFSAGFIRNIWILQETAGILYSRWQCVFVPWNWFWLFWEHGYGIILSMLSVDRLIAVSYPIWYFKVGAGYALTLVGGVHAALVLNMLVSLYFSYPHQEPIYPRICYSDWMYDPWYFALPGSLTLFTSIGSIVIYVIVLIIFKGKAKVSPAAEQSSQAKQKLRAQRRLTVTLGISCFFTFLFHILPLIVKYLIVITLGPDASVFLIPYVYIINNFNPLMNFFIYTARHRDIKMAVKCLITCKKLTPAMLGQAKMVITQATPHTGASKP